MTPAATLPSSAASSGSSKASRRSSRRSRRRQRREPLTKLPSVDVIFNPVSGHGDPDRDRADIQSVLSERYQDVRFHETTVDLDAATLARRALDMGASVVVASGGDGTVTAVAEAVRDFSADFAEASDGDGTREEQQNEAGTSRASSPSVGAAHEPSTAASSSSINIAGPHPPRLGVIPRGTANAFCSAVGIPFNLRKAARLVNKASTRRVDLARVNGSQSMLLLCGIGLEAETVKRADRELKNRFGTAAYFFAGLASIFRAKRFRASITMYDVHQRTRVGGVRGAELVSDVVRLSCAEVEAVTVANSAPPTSVLAQGIGDVRPDDGMLEVVCVSPRGGGLSMIRSMISMLQSALLRTTGVASPDVYGLRARKVELVCDPPQRVVIDGEDAGMTPIVVELDPDPTRRQLHVIAPKARVVTRRRRRLSRALVRGFRNLRGVGVFAAIVWGLRRIKASQTAIAASSADELDT